ncbi:MAG: hypothetical protein J6R23_00510 [Spirochaetales bacterium]|nr:hypothetical protein [Spirochaetales bacterium]
MRLIWDRNLNECQIYKRANIDRRLFSKIRSNASYHPSKKTALSLSVALCLSIKEAEELLSRAGFSFSPSTRMDIIYRFFIENEIFDNQCIEELLYELDI